MRFEQLREQVEEARQRFGVPGVALGLLHDGQAHTAGLGVTSVENPLPVTPDTLFQIGSISKTFTGTAIMRLVEQGRLAIEAPVRRYLPDLRLADERVAEQLTIWHLLTHTSGFRGDFFLDTGDGDDALARYVARMDELAQLTAPGELFSYCNSGFALAGRVIEAATGGTVEAALRDLVIAPLGLERATLFAAEAMTHRFAMGHAVTPDGARVLRPWPIPRAHAAVGGISASVGELLRYGRAHLSGGGLLAAESRERMQAAQAPAGNFADDVGLTWMLRTIGGVRLVRHGGATYGQLAELVLAPERGFALALLTNGSRGGELNTEVVKLALAGVLGAADPEPRFLELPEARLAEYAGRYDAYLDSVEVRAADGGLVAQVLPSGGFPTIDSPAPPAPPPTRLRLFAEDRALALDPPYRDARVEFVRGAGGAIAWMRMGGRIHRRADV